MIDSRLLLSYSNEQMFAKTTAEAEFGRIWNLEQGDGAKNCHHNHEFIINLERMNERMNE